MEEISINGIIVLVEESERYVQINDVGMADIRALWAEVRPRYASCDVVFCYHNPKEPPPTAFFHEIGSKLWEDSLEMRLTPGHFIAPDTEDAVRITEDGFAALADRHDRKNPEMYWNSRRVRADFDNWAILALWRDGRITGYILLAMWHPTLAEIYCVDAPDTAQAQVLIAAAAKLAFSGGKSEVLFMADADTIALDAARTTGFQQTGHYQAYKWHDDIIN